MIRRIAKTTRREGALRRMPALNTVGKARRGVAMAMAAVALCAAATAAEPPTVSAVRAWEHPTHTRLVIEVSASIEYSLFTLNNPRRLVIDFPELAFALPMVPLGTGPVGVVGAMRFGLFEPGHSRVVLDLAVPARVKASFLLPPADGKPYRFVLDLKPTDEASFAAAARRPAAAPRLAVLAPPAATPPRRADGKHVVVIDAGHGGVDPGAIGASGVYEKTIALAAAKQLAELLRATGRYHVQLTRQGDRFIRLRQRVRMARDAGADMFLSLHADSIADSRVRGSHVYTLSKTASDAEGAALAARENKADIIAGLAEYSPVVNTILLDLSQRETNNRSAEVAERVVEEFRRAGVHSLGRPHRQAGFAVLKAPDVPSVLVELGFLSNSVDEAMLSDAAARRPLIEALVRAVDRHFDFRTAANQ